MGSNSNQLNSPDGIIYLSGKFYIADVLNNRIQKWVLGATEGTTVAGGNGLGSNANQFNYPRNITLDASGNLYIADQNNFRIQKWVLGQLDTDGDGIGDACDTATDTDGDGVTDDVDQCPDTPNGESVDANGCPLPLFVVNISFVKNVYPNPTDNELIVDLKDNSKVKKVEFIDFNGKLIKPNKVVKNQNRLDINVSNLNNGIYLLNITTDKEVNKVKVIIER